MGISFGWLYDVTVPEKRLRAQYRSFLIYNGGG